MRLSEYLKNYGVKRSAFAKAIDKTPASVTGYCNGSFKPSAETVHKIEVETKGKVRLKDFVDEAAPAPTGAAQ